VSARGAAVLPAPPVGPPSRSRRAEFALWLVVALAVVVTVGAAARGRAPVPILAAVVVPLVLVAGQRVLLAWQTLLGAILVVILFIPIRRYTIGGGGPVALEPYRVLIAIVLGCWLCALAADPTVRWRATGLAPPIATILLAIVASLALNITRVSDVSSFVIKQLTFFASYFLVLCFVASVIRPGAQLDRMLRVLVGGGAIVACFAIYEWRTGINYFNDLGRYVPFLHYVDQGAAWHRGTGVRALASAQHPIALGAALVMLVPLAVYLYKRSGRIVWLGAGGVLTLASFSTNSRTAAVMLVVLFVCFLWFKRAAVVRMLPALLVLLVVAQAVMPGTLTSFKTILNPSFVIKEQEGGQGTGTGRLADLGPSLKEWTSKPLLGEGFGTRITDPDAGALGSQQILDDQWLSTLLEIGAIGVFGLGWLYGRTVRRLGRAARRDAGPRGWLLTALASSITAFAVGMLTFDAFAFVQVTFLSFVYLGFAVVALRGDHDEPAVAQG
jgi:hypothetical protein